MIRVILFLILEIYDSVPLGNFSLARIVSEFQDPNGLVNLPPLSPVDLRLESLLDGVGIFSHLFSIIQNFLMSDLLQSPITDNILMELAMIKLADFLVSSAQYLLLHFGLHLFLLLVFLLFQQVF